MVEGGGGAAFPVLFYDGEREMDIGDVEIHPELEYKPFQQMLSQKIGISPNQISIYLINRRRKSPFAEERRRVPITGKVNFASVCRQKGCSFLVVLKRSRKSRNRRERMINGSDAADFLPENEFSPAPMRPVPENMILLRRNQPMPFYDHITQSELDDLNCRLQLRDLNGRMRNLTIQKENYQTTMAEEHLKLLNLGLDFNSFPTIEDIYRPNSACLNATRDETREPFCEECWNAKQSGGTASFHLCVHDAVVTRSTTRRLGPINRPSKSLP